MRLTALRPEIQQRLAIGVPLVALALSMLVVYPGCGRYRKLSKVVVQKRADLHSLQTAPLAPPGPVAPAADDVPTESPQFLGQISAMATAAGCQVVGFDVTPAATSPATGAVRAVRAKIDLEGRYPQIRIFLARLTAAPRLFAVSDLTLTNVTATAAGGPGGIVTSPAISSRTVHATVEIERYVAPPLRAATSPNP